MAYKRCFVVAFLALLLIGGQTAVAQQPAPIDDYWALLATIRETASRVATQSPADQTAALQPLADELAALTAVALPNGRIIPLDNQLLLDALRRPEPDIAGLQAAIDARMASRDAWSTQPFTDAAVAALERILADPQFNYQPPPPNPLQEWLDQIQQRIIDLINRILPDNLPGGETVGRALPTVSTILLVLLLLYAFRGLIADLLREATLPASDELDELNLTADAALERAQSFSNDGDYRTAVRYLYLSALLLLEERGLLRYDRSLTNREYLRSVAHKPELAAVLRDVIDVFDRVWYGFQPLEGAEYNHYVQRVETLKQQRSTP